MAFKRDAKGEVSVADDVTLPAEKVAPPDVWSEEAMYQDADKVARDMAALPGTLLVKYVKRVPGRGVQGRFLGYLPTEMPDLQIAGVMTQQNWVLLEMVSPDKTAAAILKVFGTAQIMQQLLAAQPGNMVGISWPNKPEIPIDGGKKRVVPADVFIGEGRLEDSVLYQRIMATTVKVPIGKWGESHAMAQRALSAGVQVRNGLEAGVQQLPASVQTIDVQASPVAAAHK